MKIENLLPFLKEMDLLKKVERKTLLHTGGRYENTAEHSWHLALAVMLFRDFASKDCDLSKAIQMALLHDIVEIDAGDVMIYADQSNKKTNEARALERLLGLLPDSKASEFKKLWEEFEEGTSSESKYVSALDRFLPLYSNYLNRGHSWKQHGVLKDQVLGKNQRPISIALPELWALAEKMLEESVQKGDLSV